MQVSWRSLIALALLPFAFMTIAHAQDANDPTVYMVTYLDVTPASRAADATLLRQLAAASRNMGLMMATAGGAVPELTWLYFAIVQFPIYLLPQIVKPLVWRLTKP